MPATDHFSSKNTANAPDQLMRWLGLGGLVPFVSLAALLWIVEIDLRPWLSIALTSYAALIATFLGGVHWGIAANLSPNSSLDASQRRFHLIWGITPSLIAWLGLIMPAYAGLPLIAVLLVACYLVDRNKYPAAGLAAWLPMRLQLTAIAVLSCLIGAGAI